LWLVAERPQFLLIFHRLTNAGRWGNSNTEQSNNTDGHGDLALQVETTGGVEVIAVVGRGQQAELEKRMHPAYEWMLSSK